MTKQGALHGTWFSEGKAFFSAEGPETQSLILVGWDMEAGNNNGVCTPPLLLQPAMELVSESERA